MKNFLRMGRHPLDVERLSRERVTHLVGELFLAKLNTLSMALKRCKTKSAIPPFHLSIDILKVNGDDEHSAMLEGEGGGEIRRIYLTHVMKKPVWVI